MSASTGPSTKGEKGKSKYQSLDINSIYNSTRSEASEAQTTKSTVPRKHGMQQLGKVPQRRPPANLPSLKSENSGNDPSISLVPTGGTGWGVKPGESQQLSSGGGNTTTTGSNQNGQGTTAGQNQSVTCTTSPAPVVGAAPASVTVATSAPAAQSQSSHDKTWSSVTGGSQASSLGVEHGPSFLAHQSPQFHQEFPSLSGEPGGAPAHPTPSYGPGPSLRPQTEPGSWSQGTHARTCQPSSQSVSATPATGGPSLPPSSSTSHPHPPQNSMTTHYKAVIPSFLMSQGTGFPVFPESIQKRSRSQANHSENRLNRMGSGGQNTSGRGGGQAGTGEPEDLVHSRPIIRDEELDKMDELRDVSWAASYDVDYNEQLSFSDGESVADDDKENKMRDKSRQQHPPTLREERKEDTADKGGGGGRMDDEEMWKEKRRLTSEHKMAAAERAKQRKEEEEKRFEESRAKKSNKEMSDLHMMPSSSYPDWDKEERAKSSEHFRQMTQFPLEGRSNMNRERDREQRDMRRDRDNQYPNRFQNRPPRFRPKEQPAKIQQFSSFDKNWSSHNSFGRRATDSMDKEDEFRNKDRERHDRPPTSDSATDRFRINMREERNVDSNKRNYYDNSHMDYNQCSFQSNRETEQHKEKETNKDYDYRMNEKESSGRDNEKEWESPPKVEPEIRNFDDRIKRDNKPTLNENFPKQTNDHFEEKENEWRERPQRPESRDRPDRLDRDSRPDHRLDPRPETRLDRQDSRLEPNRDYRLDNRHDNRTDYRHESRENRVDGRENRQESRVEVQDSGRCDRPSRPDSRDSRASRNSKDSDKPCLLDGDYPLPDNYVVDKMERLTFKEKDMRREPVQRVREHVPGPITPEKMVAYEHKHNQTQLEKNESEDKESEDKKKKKVGESECGSQVWGEGREDKMCPPQETLTLQPVSTQDSTTLRTEFVCEENKVGGIGSKVEELEKRKENGGGGGGVRERREEMNKSMGGGGGRGSRSRGGGGPRSGTGGYSTTAAKYNLYPPPNWQNKDRQRRGSPRGRPKHWNPSESDGSADEISAESSKDDKKTDRKQDCCSKFGTWKSEKERRDEKKDSKVGGSDSEKERKGDRDKERKGGVGGEGGRKGESGFAPRPTGEPSRRGRGGGGGMRGQSRMGPPALYGPPGSKPFSSSTQSNASAISLDSQDKHFSPPHHHHQSGRKDDGQGKGRETEKGGGRGKVGSGGVRSQDDNWETTSETSDSSDMKKSNKNRSKTERKSRGTIGDKRNLVNSGSAHLNGRPDVKTDDQGLDKKSLKDDSDTTGYSNNGFQEVKSKKMGREGRGGGTGGGGGKEEGGKRSRSKGKEKVGGGGAGAGVGGGGGVKSQQKSYSREFVNNKPPRMQRLDNSRKQQQQQHDVSDMNKINQSVSSLFPLSRSNEVSNSCPPPPAHNAWNKPINASLRTTPPLSTTLTQLTPAPPQISTEKSNLEELVQPVNTAQANSPTGDKALTKMTREVVVEKSMLEGPPVNTIIFENTNYKRDPGDIGMKPRYPLKGPPRTTPLDKTRDRKIEDELAEGNHAMSLGGFKSSSELQAPDAKPQDNIQVPISFGKNEDNADMKLDFAFDSDLSQLSDDKTNQSIHVGQSSAADLNQKIASVKKVWDSAPGMSGHVDEGSSSSFSQGFSSDKSLDPTAASHHTDHTDFNTPDSVYGGQLSSGAAYVATGSSMMKPDAIVSGSSTMCKTNMFQVSQPQQVTVLPHPGPLSTPPPLPNVLSFQPGYSSNLSAVPSPPNVLYNSQQAAGPQTEIYQTYSLGTAQIHGSGSRSYADFPPPSYNMSQNSTFQPSMYAAPPTPQSVFQNPTQYRIPPHGSAAAALSQQMNSNPSTMLMSSTSNSVVSATQVKSSQGSMQPTAIGSKSGGGPPTATFPPSPQILLIEPPTAVSFLHQGYHRPATIQHSSSYFAANSPLAPGGSTGGLFGSASLLSGGGGGGTTPGSLPSASPFAGPGAASYSQQQPPSSSQPPYPTHSQPQMGATFRTQAAPGYPKHPSQNPSDSAKSSSQDQFQSMFQTNVQGCSKGSRMGVGKPQPSGSPQPQAHKFSSYNTNAHSVSQPNLGYQQSSASNGGASRQAQAQVQQVGMRSGGSVTSVVQSQPRYISPIQRPLGPTYNQQAAMMQQRQQQQHRMQQQQQGGRGGGGGSQQNQPPKQQYYQQQGGGMKLEGSESVKSEVEEQAKCCPVDKSSKDEQAVDQ